MSPENTEKAGVSEEVKDTSAETQTTDKAQGAKEEVSPASATVDGTAKPVEEPWHKSERFTKLTDRARKAEERLEAMQEKYEEILLNQARLGGMFYRNGKDTVDPERRQAAIQLAQILRDTPEVGEILGFGGIKALQEELEAVKANRNKESFDAEFDKNLSLYGDKFGLSKDELTERFNDFIRENEFFGSKDYSRGMVNQAFRAMLFDQQTELKERETNLKLIKEKQTKQSQGTETTSKGNASKNVNIEKNMSDFLARRVREEGGEIAFD